MKAKDYEKIIFSRSSCRNFKTDPLTDLEIEQIQAILDKVSLRTGPFGNKIRLFLIAHQKLSKEEAGELKASATIRGAKSFIVGIVKKNKMDYEDFGYLFEHVVLDCTELGLATVWMGSTFNRPAFEKYLKMQEDEAIPAITPIGHSKDSQGLIGGIFRKSINADNRKPWSEIFFKDNFSTPIKAEACPEKYKKALEWVNVGPSARNKQPWRLLIKDNEVHFYLEAESMENNLPAIRGFQRMDIGIAMAHFEIGMDYFGEKGKWAILDDINIKAPKKYQYISTFIEKQQS